MLGFFTVLPLSRAGSLEDTARACWLLPLVAVLLGGMEGLAGWGSLELFGQPVAAAVILAAALLLTGLHHTDGLADLGDSLMVHGDPVRRIEVLKDRTMGAGAAGALILTYLITWAALLQILSLSRGANIVWAIMMAEASARLSLIVVASVARPSHDGSGRIFLEQMRGWRSAMALGLSLGALALLAAGLSLLSALTAASAAIAVGLALAAAGRRWFGGSGGDILGASVELGRMAALLALAGVLLHWP